jgi:hypothetical protein
MIEGSEQSELKPTLERNCHACANSHFNSMRWLTSMTTGWPAGLSCASCADAPGELRDVTCRRPCVNFRPKRPPQVPRVPRDSPDDSIRFIPLSQGLYATVDAADYERVSQYKWFATGCRGKVYAARHVEHRLVLMHRFIMNPPRDKCVDHSDGNGLNNRRANLRICTLQENSCNKHGKRKFIGVYPYGKTGKYQGRIMKQGRSYHTCLFDDPLDAARARDRMAIKLHGPFAYLNIPEEAQANGERTMDGGGRKAEDGG